MSCNARERHGSEAVLADVQHIEAAVVQKLRPDPGVDGFVPIESLRDPRQYSAKKSQGVSHSRGKGAGEIRLL